MSLDSDVPEQDIEQQLQQAVRHEIDRSYDNVMTALDNTARRIGASEDQVTKAIAEYDVSGDWVDAWIEYVADS